MRWFAICLFRNHDHPRPWHGESTFHRCQYRNGKIGKALKAIKDEPTLLQKETGKIIKSLLIIGGILCVVVILVYGFTRGNWLNGFLAGLSLSMAILPKNFQLYCLFSWLWALGEYQKDKFLPGKWMPYKL